MNPFEAPSEVFKQLGVGAKFDGGLRNAQAATLDKYVGAGLDPRVIGIELPTGAGKSVIGLLVAESHRRSGHSVAYLCDTDALAERVVLEAQELDVAARFIPSARKYQKATDRDIDLEDYEESEIVGVYSYRGFLNAAAVRPPDVLIVDDAHAFEDELVDAFGVSIEKKNAGALYQAILSRLKLHGPLAHLIEAYQVGGLVDQDQVQLIPFHIVNAEASWIRNQLWAFVKADQDHELNWQASRFDALESMVMMVGRDGVAFRPYCSSVWDLAVGYQGHVTLDQKLQRLVLMSATLGTPVSMKERFGLVGDVRVIDAAAVDAPTDITGRRLVVPLSQTGIQATVSIKAAGSVAKLVSLWKKALVLSNSDRDSKMVRTALYTSGTDKTPINYYNAGDIEAFKRREAGALIATNRAIGLDLSSKWCPAGVQVRIPYVVDPLDALRKNVVGDQPFVEEKLGHRLAQAFGRLNRGKNDNAVYFVTDDRFHAELRNPTLMASLPRNLRGEVRLGWREAGRGSTIAEASGRAATIREWPDEEYAEKVEAHAKRMDSFEAIPRPAKEAHIDLVVAAWRLLMAGRFADAAPLLESAADGLSADEPDLAAWHRYCAAQAHFLAAEHQGMAESLEQVSRLLHTAYDGCSRPWVSQLPGYAATIEGSDAPALPLSAEEREVRARVAERMREVRRRETSLDGALARLDADLQAFCKVVSEGTHNQICDALERNVLSVVGFDNIIRERPEGESLDIAAYSTIEAPRYAVVFEIKTPERAGTQVVQTDVDQLVADVAAQKSRSGAFEEYLGCIVSTRDDIHPDAIEIARKCGVRILRGPALCRLAERIYDRLQDYLKLHEQGQGASLLAELPSPALLVPLLRPRDVVEIELGEVEDV